MPEIGGLAPAIAASDDDELPVSQAGIVRRVSRAQLLAGVQPGLSVPPQTLLGRTTAGTGAPETIRIGANLTLAAGMLAASAPFSAATLPSGRAPYGTDLVPIAQAGRDAAIAYAPFMAGLGDLGGIDLSRHLVQAGPEARTLADSLADVLPVEAFGAVGDGVADDSDALDAALATGRPVLLGPRTYARRGQWTIGINATLLGTPGRTRLRQIARTGGAFVSVQSTNFAAYGVTFDAGNISDGWGVLVTPTCASARFDTCGFTGAAGKIMGCGLVLQGLGDPAQPQSQAQVLGCELHGNQAHGLWVRSGVSATVQGCTAYANGAYGLCVDDNDPGLRSRVRRVLLHGNRAWTNQRGIQIGNFNATNLEPPTWGPADPDADTCMVCANLVHDNAAYGIAVAGQHLLVQDNLLADNGAAEAGGGGILAHTALSRIAGNAISGRAQYGIDAGGSSDTCISGNHVTGHSVGINPGGSQRVRVDGNHLAGNSWGITVFNVETDGQGANFGAGTEALTIEANHVTLSGPTGGGILLRDAPQGVLVAHNRFFSASGAQPSQALWAHTDAVTIYGNTWDNEQRIISNPLDTGALQPLQVPDIADDVMVTAAPNGITSIIGQHQAATAGSIGYIRVVDAGRGYTRATVRIIGSGAGAKAHAYLRGGRVIGVALTDPGSGYAASPATVVIEGDGLEAAAVASVGLPVPEGRRLRVFCNGPIRFAREGSSPLQDNWTRADLVAPAGSQIEWVGTWGSWHAAAFSPGAYLNVPGEGGLVLHASQGDLTLRPGSTGRLHIGADDEPIGFISTLGRGSPEGVVVAPPGSDYRNLDGGADQTFWLKRTGDGSTGWTAIG